MPSGTGLLPAKEFESVKKSESAVRAKTDKAKLKCEQLPATDDSLKISAEIWKNKSEKNTAESTGLLARLELMKQTQM